MHRCRNKEEQGMTTLYVVLLGSSGLESGAWGRAQEGCKLQSLQEVNLAYKNFESGEYFKVQTMSNEWLQW